MGLSIATTIVGFGPREGERYVYACKAVCKVLKVHTVLKEMQFTNIPESLSTFTTDRPTIVSPRPGKIVSLPSLPEIILDWVAILRAISVSIPDAYVSIDINGVERFALNGDVN